MTSSSLVSSTNKNAIFKNENRIFYFAESKILYKFDTSLEQYNDNRRDGFEVTKRYNLNKINNKKLIKFIEDGNRRNDGVFSKVLTLFESTEGSPISDFSLLSDKETDIYNDELARYTSKRQSNGGRDNRNSTSDKGKSEGINLLQISSGKIHGFEMI